MGKPLTITKVLVCRSVNSPPNEQIEEALSKMGPRWRVLQATTTVAPYGEMPLEMRERTGAGPGSCLQLYYATTLVLEAEA